MTNSSKSNKPGIFRENKQDAARYEAIMKRLEAHPNGDDAEYHRLNNAAHKAAERVSYARRHRWL